MAKIVFLILFLLISSSDLSASGFAANRPSYEVAAYFSNEDFALQNTISIRRCENTLERTRCIREYILFNDIEIWYFEFTEKEGNNGLILVPKYYSVTDKHKLNLPNEDNLRELSAFTRMLTQNLKNVEPELIDGSEGVIFSGIGPGIGFTKKDLGPYYESIKNIFVIMKKHGGVNDLKKELRCMENRAKSKP